MLFHRHIFQTLDAPLSSAKAIQQPPQQTEAPLTPANSESRPLDNENVNEPLAVIVSGSEAADQGLDEVMVGDGHVSYFEPYD